MFAPPTEAGSKFKLALTFVPMAIAAVNARLETNVAQVSRPNFAIPRAPGKPAKRATWFAFLADAEAIARLAPAVAKVTLRLSATT
jgi:hypothetical protein